MSYSGIFRKKGTDLFNRQSDDIHSRPLNKSVPFSTFPVPFSIVPFSIRMLMAQSALLSDCLPRELSFNHSLQLCLALRQYGVQEQEDQMLNLLELISQKRVGKRPGRIEPRAIKRRPKPYPMLMKTRRSARAEVRKNGHPKKVK